MISENVELRTKIFDELQVCFLIQITSLNKNVKQLCVDNKLHAPALDIQPIENYKEAFQKSMEGKNRKQLILISKDSVSKL